MDERVLLVEDDATLREAMTIVLRAAGMEVTGVGDGGEVLDLVDGSTDIVVLDVMLPTVDGFELCRELRGRSQVPIVMVTAKDRPGDVVYGLQLGADDYVVKPFEAEVLVARLRAVLRRSRPGDEEVFRAGALRVDAGAYRAWSGDRELELSTTEFRLLCELVRRVGKVVTRDVLLERVWGYTYLGDSRLVDMAVKRLRDRLDGGSSDVRITTVRGVGYRLEGS